MYLRTTSLDRNGHTFVVSAVHTVRGLDNERGFCRDEKDRGDVAAGPR